jgi:alkylation response protein AidB-like acyl-CoA dehydrogenase
MQLQVNSLADEQEKLLQVAEEYFQEEVTPKATEIDRQPDALKTALQGMGDRSLLGLKIPKQWGGAELNEIYFYRFQIMVARYSGALAFLQTQHQSAGSFIANSTNESLKQEYLPRMSKGEILVGVGFSQLRRQGEPLLKAVPVPGGYELQGEVPWVSGFGFFADFIVGATLSDGKEIYCMVPLQETIQETGGNISFSPPMELAVTTSTNTVSASLHKWFEPSDRLVSIKPAGSIHQSDRQNVLHHGFFALGCAEAGVGILENAFLKKRLPFLQQAFKTLDQELTNCRTAMLEASSSPTESFEKRLQLRAWAINLAGRCTQAAVAASSGASNHKYHAAQRVYREALLFTVSGQTTAVMEATLEQLL